MNIRARFKEIIKEMYQPKPIATYLLERMTDIISTYLCVEKYSPAIELNAVVRNLFYKLGGRKRSCCFVYSLAIANSCFYISSKTVGKLIQKLFRKLEKKSENI